MEEPSFVPMVPASLDLIETDWTLVHEPLHVVNRYAHAVQRYLFVLIKNKHDAEEVAQEFFLWVSQNGLPRVRQERGRFRDYLKKVVRNNALNFLRRRQPCQARDDLADVPAREDSRSLPDQEWMVQWRSCLLKRAWKRLEAHERRAPNNLFYTALQLCAKHPREDSRSLADRAVALRGKPIRADAFRKQVSRGRRMLAQFLVNEIAQTLDHPDAAQIEEELVDVGLMAYVREFLPIRDGKSQT
jgi:Sigma-70 region 2